MITFDNTYVKLPQIFFNPIRKPNTFSPTLIAYNQELADSLGINLKTSPEQIARYFSAAEFMPGSEPVAMAYAGHQFGHFVPQLGDGRAMLLGEFISSDQKRYDIHLKGSGRTFYSRGGDGNSAIGPVIREYLVSEGVHALGIPSTRILCAVRTGEMVEREETLPGAVVTRLALAHIRVGTFEFFARQGDATNLKVLADYTIDRLYPDIKLSENKYLDFWKAVAARQMNLIVKWMSVGFIHGVMNTDNMAISGETIDFGPCAFMDEFKFNKVFSSIDRNGRYAFSNQPQIALWNLARLAECLIPLMSGTPESLGQIFSSELKNLYADFTTMFETSICQKLGLKSGNKELIQQWFSFLEVNDVDFTLSFIDLERILEGKKTFTELENLPGFDQFRTLWDSQWETRKKEEVLQQMKLKNPMTIPRNHMIEIAIRASETGNDEKFLELLSAVQKPFVRVESLTKFQTPPLPTERVAKTFCGT